MKSKMLRTVKTIAILGLIIFLVQCGNKDDEAKFSKLDGKVSLSDATLANGAIVILSSSQNAAAIEGKTIADENGMYSFANVAHGTYYVSAIYEPSNNNNLKATGTIMLTGPEVEVVVDGAKTADLALSTAVSDGTGKVSITDGWIYDNTHSTIEFEFPFDEVNALFTGHFSRADFDEMEFDETNPSAAKIKVWVDVLSIETGSASDPCGHTRDGINGCIANTFKVEKDAADTVDVYCSVGTLIQNWPNETLVAYSGDLWGDGSTTSYTKQSSVSAKTGVALFEATSVTPYGTGYVADGNFTFAGTTKAVKLYFSFTNGYTNDDNTKTYSSFFGYFKFAAFADYGIESGHVGSSDVTVKISAQFNKALE